jgi:hypothetical protein
MAQVPCGAIENGRLAASALGQDRKNPEHLLLDALLHVWRYGAQ